MTASSEIPLVIKNGRILTMDDTFSILDNTSILVENGIIEDIGSYDEIINDKKIDEMTDIDARGKIIMPGMICSHTHFYGAFSRGMALKDDAPANFVEILERLWWRLDRALMEKDVLYSALFCMADAIRHGTTTLIDHHASPQYIAVSLDTIEKAARIMGTRCCLCYEVTDRNGPEGAREGIEENMRFLHRVQRKETGITRGSFGLHASLTLGDDTLRECVTEAGNIGSGFHVHVAEDRADNRDSNERYGKSVVKRFHDLGILGPKTLATHCVHVSEEDMEILAESGTQVMHNPQSNMNNAVGVARVEAMQEKDINVGMGTDGFSQDMFREMKFVYVLHKLNQEDPRRMGGDNVLRMQTHANRKIASLFWDRPLGVIEKGALADIILLDYHPLTPMTSGNLPWHMQFGMDATNVTHTIIDGKIVMEDGRIIGWNGERMAEVARELVKDVWERF